MILGRAFSKFSSDRRLATIIFDAAITATLDTLSAAFARGLAGRDRALCSGSLLTAAIVNAALTSLAGLRRTLAITAISA